MLADAITAGFLTVTTRSDSMTIKREIDIMSSVLMSFIALQICQYQTETIRAAFSNVIWFTINRSRLEVTARYCFPGALPAVGKNFDRLMKYNLIWTILCHFLLKLL